MFKPKGEIPQDIPDMFNSREVIKDGVGVLHVVKKPSQILPYCVIKLRDESLPTMTKTVTKTGDQPLTGQMTWTKNSSTIPGYPNCGMIIITYKMMPGIQT